MCCTRPFSALLFRTSAPRHFSTSSPTYRITCHSVQNLDSESVCKDNGFTHTGLDGCRMAMPLATSALRPQPLCWPPAVHQHKRVKTPAGGTSWSHDQTVMFLISSNYTDGIVIDLLSKNRHLIVQNGGDCRVGGVVWVVQCLTHFNLG